MFKDAPSLVSAQYVLSSFIRFHNCIVKSLLLDSINYLNIQRDIQFPGTNGCG